MNGHGTARHLLISGGIGCLFWLLGNVLYGTLTQELWQPLGIGIYFALFGAVIGIGYRILSVIRGDHSWLRRKQPDQLREDLRMYFLWLLLLTVVTVGLEFLYEVGVSGTSQPTSYIFLIDDSGSMEGNDPENKRVSAIHEIMAGQEEGFPYAVYKFTDESTCLKALSPYSAGDRFEFISDGGTNIIGSLRTVVQEILQNRSAAGENVRILLLSDGDDNYFALGKRKVIRDCVDNGISVSTISFGNLTGNRLLRSLAEGTGGVYIHSADAVDLQADMTSAVTLSSARNLISERYMIRLNWLYTILRILFLTVMGATWSMMKLFAYCGRDTDGILPLSLLLCVLGAVLTEVLFALQVNGAFVRLLLCILWSLVPGQFESKTTPSTPAPPPPPAAPPAPDFTSVSGIGSGSMPDAGNSGKMTGLEGKTPQTPFGSQLSDSGSNPFQQSHSLRKD